MRFFLTFGLALLVATEPARAEAEVEQLSRTLRENPRVEAVRPLLPKISALLRAEETAFEALPVAEQAVEILLASAVETGDFWATLQLLKIAGRMRFEQAEPDQAIKHLQSLRTLYRSLGERLPPETAVAQQSRWSYEVALEYLRGEQIQMALELIGEVVDLEHQTPPGVDEMQAAVAGALHRRLEQLSTNERYELLYAWTMPSEGRRTVRVMASIASVEAPPDAFARAIGERPQANVFPVSEVGGVDGLFSTAWSLVRAAADSGRLRRLTSELEELAKADVPSAGHVLWLARLAEESSPVEDLRGLIDKRLESLRQAGHGAPPTEAPTSAPSEGVVVGDDLQEVVVGAACLQRPELCAAGQRVFETLLELIVDESSLSVRPFLRRAGAIAILKQHAGAEANLLAGPNLKFWIPASEENALRSAAGAVRETWLAHEDHILHLAGPHNDYLCFRYPLTGAFEFQVEAQNGGREHTFGNLAFGGLAYGVAGNADEFRVWGLDMQQMLTRPFPFVRKEQWPTYQRLTLRSSDQGVQHLVNGHPVWTDPLLKSTSPWLALRCFGNYVPAFRSFRLAGDPVIPREVRMSDGNLLRGWFTQFYPSNVSPAVPLTDEPAAIQAAPTPTDAAPYDWYIREGVIHGTHREELFRSAAQSRLTYFRPLQNDESIDYEFLYEPGQHEVHPALGRLAFLIEPGGVRMHWLTGGAAEWTGLDENNATIEPLNRRGPRPLPLQAGEWNRVAMALQADTLTLTLNDVEIYSRKMEAENSRRFSLYHDRNRAAVQARNVVLRGNWPEQLTEEDRKNLLAPRAGPDGAVGAVDRRSLGAMFDDRHVADTALSIHRRAAALPAEARFAFLADYVMPGESHDELRLSLEFSAANPPPSPAAWGSLDERPAWFSLSEAADDSPVHWGATLVSPALDLVDVARELGRLDDLRRAVVAAPQSTEHQQRQRLALLALIDMAKKDFTGANESLFQLLTLVDQGAHTEFSQRWPETLAAHVAIYGPATRNAGRELAVLLHLRQARNGADSGSEAWRRHVAAMVGLSRYLDETTSANLPQFNTLPPWKQWTTVSHQTAQSRGFGFPAPLWHLQGTGLESSSRHDEDYLYFQSPLRGNYEVEYDVPAFGWRDTQMMVAGEWVSARFDLKSYSHGNFRRQFRIETIAPPLVRPEEWLHCRVTVGDGVVKHYANGRLIREIQLAPHADPWVAIRSDTPGHGAAKNIWISGHPEIPAVIQLAGTNELEGWLAYYNAHSVGGSDSNWRQRGDLVNGGGVVGRYQPELAGLFAESLFRYHRPMLEDGAIEYDFYYREGESHCHPALDRLAFLLEPSGVRVHWITDGPYDRTALTPDNVLDEPENRRGPAKLPLINGAWNRLVVMLRGPVVQLWLNGQAVYERELEATNQRTFGLFHYADQTEARVRYITWRGGWPRELPALADQELSGEHPTFLDERLPELAARFEHDFARDGFPLDKFSIIYGSAETFAPRPDGLHIDHRGGNGYRNAMFAARLRVHGDFDITADYEQLDTVSAPDGSVSLYLQATLDNELQTECSTMRRHSLKKRGADEQYHQTALVQHAAQGERRSYSRQMASETSFGRLRLARRGTTVYYLLAEGDSPLFRLARVEELTADDIADGNLRIINQTHGPGELRVVWKSLSIRAEKLTGLALENPSEIVARLDRERAMLPVRFVHDFARERFTPERFHHWGFNPPLQPSPPGLVVSGPATDNWTSAGAAPQLALQGDFDISFEFDLLRMTPPKAGLSSAVYLQLEVPDESQHQYSIILVGEPEGGKHVTAQHRERTSEGGFAYPSISREPVQGGQRLRLARRGGQLYFLFAEVTSQHDRLLAQHEVATVDIPATFARMLVHTGGAGKSTEAAWKRISINAQ